MGVGKMARSICDPFITSSCVPDGSAGQGCFTVRQTGTLITGAAGTCCGIAINADPANLSVTDSGSAVGTILVPANWSGASAYTAIQQQYRRYRPVSMGLKVSYIGATTSDQGLLVVGQVSPSITVGSFTGGTSGGAAQTTQWFKTYPVRDGAIITWRPEDPDDFVWRPVNAAGGLTTAGTNSPWIYCWAFGCNSNSSVMQYELVVNFEGQYVLQTFLPGGLNTTPDPAVPGWYEMMRNMVRNVAPIVPYIHKGTQLLLGGNPGSSGRATMPRLGGGPIIEELD